MARNGSGVYTPPVNSWNPAVSDTPINAAAWNTTLADMATALTTSIASDGQTPTTVRIPFANGLQVNAGTVSLPGLNFASNASTGIYLPTAAQLGIAAGGVQALVASATGVTIPGTLSVTGHALTLTGDLTMVGAHSLTLTLTADSSLTLPTTGTVATLAGAETLTNKTMDFSSNTISNITTSMFAPNVVDTDGAMAADSNTRIPSQAAVVTYVANNSQQSRLGTLLGADFNSTADQAIAISGPSKYVITQIIVTNVSASLTTAKGTFYAAASKTNVMFVGTGATTPYTALVAPDDAAIITNSAVGAVAGNGGIHFARRTSAGTIYLSLTTPNGAPVTADVYVYGLSIV